MEYKNTNEYLDYVAYKINVIAEKLILFLVFLGPIMWIATFFNYFSISLPFCIGYTCVALICTLIQHYLNKLTRLSELEMVFGMIVLSILIPVASLKMQVEVHVIYCITVFISCLYMRIRLTRLICIISYCLLILSTYAYFSAGMTIEEFMVTKAKVFLAESIGLTVEFLILYVIAASIVKVMERMLAEREKLHKEELELYEESAAKSEFLAQMSHEIRTPINAVLGMNEMILQECEKPEVEGYAMTIRSAGKTLLSIVNDILDYSRIESGKMEIMTAEYDAAAAFKETVDVYTVQCAAKGLQFIYEIPEDMPRYLIGDEFRINQAVANLLSNAVKYTEKGAIRFHVDFYRKSQDRGRMVISVIDTGIGIRQEDISKVFLKYERLDSERNRTIQGTGLGLKICKQIVEMMGGILSVQSEYGEGSVFSIALDQSICSDEVVGNFKSTFMELEEKGIESLKKNDMVYIPDAEIMIVDDNEMNLQVASNLLKRSGCLTRCFLSGKECLEEIYRKHYDLILLDHMMPEPDGIEVLLRIRSNSDHMCQDTKIVVLTANAVNGARSQYLEEGFDDYIAKPITIEELAKILRKNISPELIVVDTEQVESEHEVIQVEESAFWDLSNYHIDVKKGVGYLGDEWEQYIAMVEIFCKDYMSRTEKLGRALEEENLSEYAVLVHGLKGNARTLGADTLGELAFEEEKAAKANNMEFLEEHQYELDQEWRLVIEGFEKMLRCKEQPAKSEILEEDLEDQILMAMACLEGRQSNQAETILKELLEYQIPQKEVSCIEEGLHALDDGDFQLAIDSLNKVWKGV